MGSVVEKLAFPAPPSIDEVPREFRDLGFDTPVAFPASMIQPNKEVKVEFIWLRNSHQHRIACLWYRVKNPKYTIIYSHGNAEDILNIGIQRTLSAYASSLGVDVFSYEYSGYSWTFQANGDRIVPAERFCYSNINRTYDFLTIDQSVKPENIIVFGKSLGTGVTVDFASRHPEIKACILQSPLLSAVRVVMSTTIPFCDIFSSIDKVERIKSPTLIIHGVQDEVVPFPHGEKLESLLRCTIKDHWWITEAGHNNIESRYWTGLLQKLNDFLTLIESYQPSPVTEPPPSFFSFSFSPSR